MCWKKSWGKLPTSTTRASGDGIKQIDERSCEALASVRSGEINEQLGLHLPEDEHFGTIGGLVFHQLGPHSAYRRRDRFTTTPKSKCSMPTRRRINRVAIEVLPPAEGAEKPEQA